MFNVSVPNATLHEDKDLVLTLKYHVTSKALQALIKDEEAEYISLVTCAATGRRDKIKSRSDEDVGILHAGDYKSSITLISYIVAKTTLAGWKSTEYSSEFSQFRRQGFDIPAGSILAAADEIRIDLDDNTSPFSIIDLVQDSRVQEGEFELDLDDVRIKIHLCPKDKSRIESLRKRGPMSQGMTILFPGLYLHAIVEALRNLDSCSAQWTSSLRRALEQKEINVEDRILKEKAVVYAQRLLQKPLGQMLTAFEKPGEE